MKKLSPKYQLFILIGAALVTAAPVLSKFFKLNFEAIIGLLCFPFVFTTNGESKFKYRWAIFSIGFIILFLLTGIMTANYFALGFLIFFIVENTYGKVNWPSLALLFIVSPFFNYLIQVFSFPVRMKLTNTAVYALNFINPQLKAEGNIIINGDIEFAVDPECMGLNLIIFSMAIGLAIQVFFEKKRGSKPTFLRTSVLQFTLLLLANLGSLFRIILITLFEAMPETVAHEMIGLTTIIIYTLIPFYGICKLLFRNKPTNYTLPSSYTTIGKSPLIIYSTICLALGYTGFIGPKGSHHEVDSAYHNIEIKGFEKSITKTNIIKLENDTALVYIKPPVGFFGADHSPMICWLGSGYAMRNTKEKFINGFPIQTSELVHTNGDTLYTSWWFDNGNQKTCQQWEWRSLSFKGAAPFRLMNVTTNSLDQTLELSKKLVSMNLFENKFLIGQND